MPRAPFELFVAPTLVAFQDSHPEVALEIAVEARLIDIVKEGYDAGLRYGNCIDKDMVALLVAPRSEAILVAAPSYLDTRAAPESPTDLLEHRAIVCRSQGTGQIIPWTLQSAGDTIHIVPTSITVVHDLASQVNLAKRGLGIVSLPAAMVSEALTAGRLSRILPAWCSTLEPLYLYFPSRRHQSAALRAFVAFLKAMSSPSVETRRWRR